MGLSPKFYDNVFLFVGSTTLWTSIEFWLVFQLVEFKTLQPLIIIYKILCMIIENVHPFIGHCLIPLVLPPTPWTPLLKIIPWKKLTTLLITLCFLKISSRHHYGVRQRPGMEVRTSIRVAAWPRWFNISIRTFLSQ